MSFENLSMEEIQKIDKVQKDKVPVLAQTPATGTDNLGIDQSKIDTVPAFRADNLGIDQSKIETVRVIPQAEVKTDTSIDNKPNVNGPMPVALKEEYIPDPQANFGDVIRRLQDESLKFELPVQGAQNIEEPIGNDSPKNIITSEPGSKDVPVWIRDLTADSSHETVDAENEDTIGADGVPKWMRDLTEGSSAEVKGKYDPTLPDWLNELMNNSLPDTGETVLPEQDANERSTSDNS
jgi:hypothetical protein